MQFMRALLPDAVINKIPRMFALGEGPVGVLHIIVELEMVFSS